MDEKVRERRVLNLLGRINRDNQTPKQWAVRKLLSVQPGAQRIRFEERCPISKCRSKFYLSYQVTGVDRRLNDVLEDCGWYCPSCGFGNAGGRPVKLPAKAAQKQSASDYLAGLKNRKTSSGIQFTHQDADFHK